MVAQNIRQLAAPSMATVVFVQPVAHRFVRRFLHADVQRGVNAQPLLVNRGRAVCVFEILANLFDEIRSQIVAPAGKMQSERFFHRSGSLLPA